METPPPSHAAAQVLDVLRGRDGLLTRVTLNDGRDLFVHNIAWGQDFADPEYHITTNISPKPSGAHAIDIFSTGDVASITDPTSGNVLFCVIAA
jgi:hypothetical protein